MERIVPLAEAVAAVERDGDTVAFAGFTGTSSQRVR
jgi:acyl CoA:acetate/3-ketoacid CoA transferase alpha subunit